MALQIKEYVCLSVLLSVVHIYLIHHEISKFVGAKFINSNSQVCYMNGTWLILMLFFRCFYFQIMASNYAKRMAWLSAKIFGEVSRPTNPTSMKVVRMFAEEPLNTKKDIVEYYPRHPEINGLMFNLRRLGLFRWGASTACLCLYLFILLTHCGLGCRLSCLCYGHFSQHGLR